MELARIKQQLTNGQLVGLTIYGEARNQSLDGKVAVGCVIRNRLWSKENFGGNTYKDICLAKNQFSCWWEGNVNSAELMRAVNAVISGLQALTPLIRECLYLGQGIVDNQIRDNVNGALYYRTIKLMQEKPVENIAWSMEIEDHVFFKLAV